MPAANTGPLYLGAYTGTWLNPVKTWHTPTNTALTAGVSAVAPTTIVNDPGTIAYPGSFGSMKWYPNEEGNPWKTTEVDGNTDFYEIKERIAAYNTLKSKYVTTDNPAYEILRKAYNTDLAKLKEWNGTVLNYMGWSQVAKPTIPDRPCPPAGVRAWNDLKIDWAGGISSFTDAKKADKTATPATNDSVKSALDSFRQGYMLASTSETPSSSTITYTTHTFGLLGQGTDTDPGVSGSSTTSKAWSWAPSTTDTHHLMFSILPYDYTDTGLSGAGDKIEILSKLVPFNDWLTSVATPDSAPAAIEPDNVHAHGLVASAIGFAAVAAALL